jgi:hypothetical protein
MTRIPWKCTVLGFFWPLIMAERIVQKEISRQLSRRTDPTFSSLALSSICLLSGHRYAVMR